MRRINAVAVGSLALGVAGLSAAPAAVAAVRPGAFYSPHHTRAVNATAPFKLSDVKHVFNIILENKTYSTTFGDPSADPYLATSLPKLGLLLEGYYSTGHASNDNYISLISGQAPNVSTQDDCGTFANFKTTKLTKGEPDQQSGDGCVYPKDIDDIGNQLSAAKDSWKGYMQDMGNVPAREAAVCGHPAVGSPDGTEEAAAGDGYATRHDPFVYFHKVIDSTSFCDAHVVPLGSASGVMPAGTPSGTTGLATDLKSVATTPAYSFITPNLCEDGHDYPCTNETGHGSNLADIDNFLETWVPKIMKSKAYKENGLIEITFDESDGASADSSACCNEAKDPNANNGLAGEDGPGGGHVGAILISPFIKPGTVSATKYNHYSTLATDEAIFGLKPLGYATEAKTFSTKLFHGPALSPAARKGVGSGAAALVRPVDLPAATNSPAPVIPRHHTSLAAELLSAGVLIVALGGAVLYIRRRSRADG